MDLGEEGVRKHGGKVRCPWRGAIGAGKAEVCSSQPWDRSALKDLLTAETMFELLESAHIVVKQATENELVLAKKVNDAEAAGGANAARALAATAAAAGQQRADRIRTHRLAIVENVLTLHCPRCSSAFLDYAGCDAVVCSKPGCGCCFCALCLADCGTDAHPHVLAAKHIPGRPPSYHSTQSQFNAFHVARRRKGVDDAVARIAEDADFKKELLVLLNKDLSEAGVAAAPAPAPAPYRPPAPQPQRRRRGRAARAPPPQQPQERPLQLDPRQFQPGFGLGRDYVPQAVPAGGGGVAGVVGAAIAALLNRHIAQAPPPPPPPRPPPIQAVPFNVAVANLQALEDRAAGKSLKDRQKEDLEATRKAIRASIAIDAERQKGIQAALLGRGPKPFDGGVIDLSGGGSGSGGRSGKEANKPIADIRPGEVVDLTSERGEGKQLKRRTNGGAAVRVGIEEDVLVDLSAAPASPVELAVESVKGGIKRKDSMKNDVLIDLSVDVDQASPILVADLSQEVEVSSKAVVKPSRVKRGRSITEIDG